MPRPSTESFSQSLRARVGPKSGPPCLRDPPTNVGAILLARVAHASAPTQPSSAIRSLRVCQRWEQAHRRWATESAKCPRFEGDEDETRP